MKEKQVETGYRIRFLTEPGHTRPATEDDQPYLDWLFKVVEEAAEGDPGEEGERRRE